MEKSGVDAKPEKHSLGRKVLVGEYNREMFYFMQIFILLNVSYSSDAAPIKKTVSKIPSSFPSRSSTPPLHPFIASGAVIASWFVANGALLMTNKYLMSTGFKDKRLPLSLTALHMLVSSITTNAMVTAGLVPRRQIANRKQFMNIFWLAAVSGLSIVMGIGCLRYIALSLEQAVGATTPAFTAVLAYLMIAKTETVQVYSALGMVVLGIVISSGGDPVFNMFGFLLAVGSTVLRGAKSVFQEIIMSHDPNKLDAMNLLRFSSTMLFFTMTPIAMIVEGAGMVNIISSAMAAGDTFFLTMLLTNCLLAATTNFTQFLMTKMTSAVTSQVVGNVKSACVALISILVFKNPVTSTVFMGYTVTFCAAAWYTQLKNSGH